MKQVIGGRWSVSGGRWLVVGWLCVLGGWLLLCAPMAQAQAAVSWSWDFAATPWCDAARQTGCVAWITLNAELRTANSERQPLAGAWASSMLSGYPGLTTGTPIFRYWRAVAALPDPAGDKRFNAARWNEVEIARRAPPGPALRVTADPQTGQGTQLEISFDPASDPLCASATETDCVAQAVLQRAGGDVRILPFSAFTVTSGVAAATVEISTLPVGYGANDFVAVLDGRAADGSLVRSDVSPTVSVVRRPNAPGLRKN